MRDAFELVVLKACLGDTGIRFAADDRGQTPIRLPDIELEVSEPRIQASRTIYFSCEKICGSGGMSATCSFPDGKIASKDADFRVIEPLRKLVCTEAAPNGGYYNPSRLVYGTNAWLKVGVNGDFNSFEVRWRVVSGPGRIVDIQGWAALVEPTAPAGEVVVEAAFGSDSAIQPQFVLPIVEKRVIPVRAFVVLNEKGIPVIASCDVLDRVNFANRLLSQTGIELRLEEEVRYLDDSMSIVISEHNVRTNANGHVYLSGYHPQVTNLIAKAESEMDVKLFWVKKIVNGTPLAFTVPHQKSCIMSIDRRISKSVLPHEIGHLLGLEDIYERRKGMVSEKLPQGNYPICGSLFADEIHDWTSDVGRGFYSKTDSHSLMIRNFLMHGRDEGGVDIPFAAVEGYSAESKNIFDTRKVAIGSSNIRKE